MMIAKTLTAAAWALQGATPARRRGWLGSMKEAADDVLRKYPDISPLRGAALGLREHVLACAESPRAWRMTATHRTALELARLLDVAGDAGDLEPFHLEENDMTKTTKKPTAKPKTKKPKTKKPKTAKPTAKLPPKLPPKRATKAQPKRPSVRTDLERRSAKRRQQNNAGIDTNPPSPRVSSFHPVGKCDLSGEMNLLAAYYAADHAALATVDMKRVPHGAYDPAWSHPAAEPAKRILCPLWGDDNDRLKGMAPKWFKGWDEAKATIVAECMRADKTAPKPMGVHRVNALLVVVARDKKHPLYHSRVDRKLDQAFLDSIHEHGVDDPVVGVYRNGIRVVVAGRQRTAGVHAVNRGRVLRWFYEKRPLQLLDIPIDVRNLTDDAARRLMARENAQREQLSKLEEAEEALALKARGLPQRAIALELKISTGQVNNLLQLERLESVLREQMIAGDLPLKVAYELSRLPAARQILLWKQCKGAPSPLVKLRELLSPGSTVATPGATRSSPTAWWRQKGGGPIATFRQRLETQTDPQLVLLRNVLDALGGDQQAAALLPTDFRLLLLDESVVHVGASRQLDLEEEANRKAREEEADESDDYADGDDDLDDEDLDDLDDEVDDDDNKQSGKAGEELTV